MREASPPSPLPPALSRQVHGLLSEWQALDRLPYPRRDGFHEDDEAFGQRVDAMGALLARLATTRCRTPADTVAKMAVLCRLLREEDQAETALALAESIRDSLTLLALLAAPPTDAAPLLA